MKNKKLIFIVLCVILYMFYGRQRYALSPIYNLMPARNADEASENSPGGSILGTASRRHVERGNIEATLAVENASHVAGNVKHGPGGAVTNITAMVKEIGQRHDFVVLLYLNIGYLNITKSWTCNVECMGILSQTVFVCSDAESYWSLKNWKPTLNVILHRFGTAKTLTWGQDSYFEFLLYRAQSVESVLRDDHSVFLVESDAVWLKNPTVLFKHYANKDLILVANRHAEDEKERKALPAFAYLNATANTKSLWGKLVELCTENLERYKEGKRKTIGGSDMSSLNVLIRSEPVEVQWLPEDKFVGGGWYGGSEYNEEFADSLIVLHNNFIIGNDKKEERAKLWGHWFLSDDGTKCTGHPCTSIPVARPITVGNQG